jgi:hypothetical protein
MPPDKTGLTCEVVVYSKTYNICHKLVERENTT